MLPCPRCSLVLKPAAVKSAAGTGAPKPATFDKDPDRVPPSGGKLLLAKGVVTDPEAQLQAE